MNKRTTADDSVSLPAGLSARRMAFFVVTQGRRKRWIARAIRWLACLVIVYFVLRWFEHRQVYQPYAELEAAGSELGRPFEDVYFETADGVKLSAWFFPADTNSPRRQRVFLLCHGNAGNISHRLDHAGALLETGAAAFLFDYRGYGRSQGTPGEAGTYLDAQAAQAWLQQKGFAATNIVALGESLGGGIASELALRETLGGLILQSTFTSITDVGAELFPWLPVRWMNRIKYDTHGKLPRIKAPVLVMHSRADSLIRFQHAERNFAAANEPKLLWEIGGDHNDFLDRHRARYIEGLERFLSLLEGGRKPEAEKARIEDSE
ncbi:MAG TPA: alpha/beta hydrolase [Verrucomicrobiae bacterium]|nr:alpha/beta hydrolase [Verrucomicrobiae bacterium]